MSVIKTKTSSDNVVIFPKAKANVPPMSIEELDEKLKSVKLEVAEHLAEELTKEVGRIMSDNGYMITHVADLAFLLITVKAVLLRHEKIHHPVQDFIDENIILSSEDSEQAIDD